MKKCEVINELFTMLNEDTKTPYTKKEVRRIYDIMGVFFEKNVVEHNCVTVPRIGKIVVKNCGPSNRRNPRDGSPVLAPAKKRTRFKACCGIKEAINI